jgi:cell division septation protein DedD
MAPLPASARVLEPGEVSQGGAGKTPAAPAGFSVQVGSFQYRDQAERLRHRLAQKGYQASVQPTAIAGKGVWYRVQVGGSPDRATADRLAQQLSTRERVTGMVVDGAR